MTQLLDFFTIGIGPSSSHTVGPMKAVKQCLAELDTGTFYKINSIHVDLYGSLAFTGHGHATDKAIVLGLLGYDPATVSIKSINTVLEDLKEHNTLLLLQKHLISFSLKDIRFNKKLRKLTHPNTLVISANDSSGNKLFSSTYFSVGGGFVITEHDFNNNTQKESCPPLFNSAKELLNICKTANKPIWQVVYDNESNTTKEVDLIQQVNYIWSTMKDCVSNGLSNSGILPGGLNVKRRAKTIYKDLIKQTSPHPSAVFDWVSVFALAVNEENAAGGRVVTAPTNGAAGIIPAILHYYEKFYSQLIDKDLCRFFFTAGAIASLYKLNASISGAEMGCQGEIGVASSMAAAGLTELLGGSTTQIECAAEIAMEHHLGLTCDPVKGLVQIPCIERNTFGAIKAINAAQLALKSNGNQKVTLDKVIKTMKQTGNDMKKRYKETSKGGLAINVIEC